MLPLYQEQRKQPRKLGSKFEPCPIFGLHLKRPLSIKHSFAWKISGEPRIEPRTTGWGALTLPTALYEIHQITIRKNSKNRFKISTKSTQIRNSKVEAERSLKLFFCRMRNKKWTKLIKAFFRRTTGELQRKISELWNLLDQVVLLCLIEAGWAFVEGQPF